MSYQHGIRLEENPTSIQQPMLSYSAVQVVLGTAPINMAENIKEAVNKPIIAHTFDEAKKKLGYSDDWKKYTLCEVMDVSFKKFKVAPLIFINVLDPEVHKEKVTPYSITLQKKQAVIEQEGVLLDSLEVKSGNGETTYEKNKDYVVAFNQSGKPLISVLPTGNIGTASEVQVTYDKLKPESVTKFDIIGGYDSEKNSFKGAELIQTIYPTLEIVPNLLLAPGFSHEAEVGAILAAKSIEINGSFKATNLLDVKGKTKEEAYSNKETNDFTDKTSIICWPKSKIKDKIYHYSSVFAATIARTDAENEDVPYKSPSNKKIPISAMVNEDGQELFLDQVEGNVINGYGIVTAINMGGWRTWGNDTAAFLYKPYDPTIMDPKDRFIAVRRMFDWWGNTFIRTYFDKVDDPTNTRLIESVVDSENIRANGFSSRGQIAGAKIEFRQEDNPVNELLNGKIKFIQKVAFYTPAQEMVNVLEFDPNMLTEALFGGEQG